MNFPIKYSKILKKKGKRKTQKGNVEINKYKGENWKFWRMERGKSIFVAVSGPIFNINPLMEYGGWTL